MIEQIQEFVTDKASALTNQVEKIRKESVVTVREAVALSPLSAGDLSSSH